MKCLTSLYPFLLHPRAIPGLWLQAQTIVVGWVGAMAPGSNYSGRLQKVLSTKSERRSRERLGTLSRKESESCSISCFVAKYFRDYNMDYGGC